TCSIGGEGEHAPSCILDGQRAAGFGSGRLWCRGSRPAWVLICNFGQLRLQYSLATRYSDETRRSNYLGYILPVGGELPRLVGHASSYLHQRNQTIHANSIAV